MTKQQYTLQPSPFAEFEDLYNNRTTTHREKTESFDQEELKFINETALSLKNDFQEIYNNWYVLINKSKVKQFEHFNILQNLRSSLFKWQSFTNSVAFLAPSAYLENRPHYKPKILDLILSTKLTLVNIVKLIAELNFFDVVFSMGGKKLFENTRTQMKIVASIDSTNLVNQYLSECVQAAKTTNNGPLYSEVKQALNASHTTLIHYYLLDNCLPLEFEILISTLTKINPCLLLRTNFTESARDKDLTPVKILEYAERAIDLLVKLSQKKEIKGSFIEDYAYLQILRILDYVTHMVDIKLSYELHQKYRQYYSIAFQSSQKKFEYSPSDPNFTENFINDCYNDILKNILYNYHNFVEQKFLIESPQYFNTLIDEVWEIEKRTPSNTDAKTLRLECLENSLKSSIYILDLFKQFLPLYYKDYHDPNELEQKEIKLDKILQFLESLVLAVSATLKKPQQTVVKPLTLQETKLTKPQQTKKTPNPRQIKKKKPKTKTVQLNIKETAEPPTPIEKKELALIPKQVDYLSTIPEYKTAYETKGVYDTITDLVNSGFTPMALELIDILLDSQPKKTETISLDIHFYSILCCAELDLYNLTHNTGNIETIQNLSIHIPSLKKLILLISMNVEIEPELKTITLSDHSNFMEKYEKLLPNLPDLQKLILSDLNDNRDTKGVIFLLGLKEVVCNYTSKLSYPEFCGIRNGDYKPLPAEKLDYIYTLGYDKYIKSASEALEDLEKETTFKSLRAKLLEPSYRVLNPKKQQQTQPAVVSTSTIE